MMFESNGSKSSVGPRAGLTRRSLLGGGAAAAMVGLADICCNPSLAAATTDVAPPGAVPKDAVTLTGELRQTTTRVILLGTAAGPFPAPGRQGCSSLVMVGDRGYLVDAGYGVVRKFVQSGVPLNNLKALFVTHLHSDHIADVFNLFMLGWGPENQGIYEPVTVIGPGNPGQLPAPAPGVTPAPLANPDNPTPGIVELLSQSVDAFAYDLNIRTRYNERRGLPSLIDARDLLPPADAGASPTGPYAPDMAPFPIYEDDRVRVSATLALHPPVYPSFAYRFETEDATIVFSGDTARSDNVVRLAEGADLLVHETLNVDYYAGIGYSEKLLEFLESSHTSPADVGRVASAAGVRRVALSHIGPPDPRAVTDREWRRAVCSTFGGDVVVGHDLYQLAFPPDRQP